MLLLVGVIAMVFAFKLSLVFSFMTNVLFAKVQSRSALTAGWGAMPCIAAR